MRTVSGINLRISEITIFEQISTAVADMPMPTPFTTDVVVASKGHVPKINLKEGFCSNMPFRSTAPRFFKPSPTPDFSFSNSELTGTSLKSNHPKHKSNK